MKFHVGTDVGGTFTDLWVLASDRRTRVFKAPTTADIITGIVDVVRLAAEAFEMTVNEFCASIQRFGHGSTVGLNALLTGHTAKTAIITTAGFGDTLEIARMKRQLAGLNELEVSNYYLRGQWGPLVPRCFVYEVPERINRRGQVIQPLNLEDAQTVIRSIASEGFESIAICTLWATENPTHEQQLRNLVLEALPGIFVSLSHEVSPAVGEYARMSTTAANAALGPVVSRYLERLNSVLKTLGLPVDILAMTGGGGVVSLESLARLPVTALFSGPAAGVIGCHEISRKIGKEKVLTIDVGGTSFDVGKIVDGVPLMRSDLVLAGADIRIPSLDVSSIGAGGGSIAVVQHGALSVGPQSAGSLPGPACYGRGGTQPTATDADLILGVLDPNNFVGGRMKLDKEAAANAIQDQIALPLGLSLMEAAWGIREVLDSHMSNLLRRVTIERGHDPRDFVLFANGGAGPSHAWTLCRDLGIETFVVPATATGQSAYGTGTSDLRRTTEKTSYLRIPPTATPETISLQGLREARQVATNEVVEALRREALSGAIQVECSLAIRYRGQAHHLTIALEDEPLTPTSFFACLERFEREYEALFGRGAAFREAGFEVLYVRATGTGELSLPVVPLASDPLTLHGSRRIVFDDPLHPLETPVYTTECPAPGQRVDGPCVIEYPGQTVVVPPGGRASTDELGNLFVTVEGVGMVATNDTLSSITYEVIRNRLIAIGDEMRIALQSVSGSPTVTEATDFFTGLFLPNGTFATMGFQVTLEAPPVGSMIRHLCSKGKVSINPGDMFIGNDPYIGALHQNDVQMTGPIFYEGEVIAWAGVMAHQTDVGGMDFASWSPKAREIFQEGMRIPGVKLVDGGVVREDVLEFILSASRLPASLGLDIRAFIATLHVANARVVELVKRYGSETVRATMQRMIEVSEIRMRERLAELPDAEIHMADFLEHDGHQNRLYKVDLLMTKQGDSLRLDFSGSSPQAPGFINATRAGLHGGVAGSIIPTLGFDIPWNEGILHPVEIIAPDGLICTARHPAPVGSATVEAIWVINNLTTAALNKLLACSPRYRYRAQAVSSGTMATFNMGGVNQFGERFGLHLLDPLAGGSGAYATKDGINAGGPVNVPMPCIADVELNEQVAPLHYLYRRLGEDTGGAGFYRGGLGGEMAVMLGGIEQAELLIMTHGLEVPNSMGMFGGWPGATIRQRLGRQVLREGRYPAERLPADPADLGGQWEEFGPKPGLLPVTKEDVFAVVWQGGGGWGDPLDRDPQAVWTDVCAGVISPQAAHKLYGVVCIDGGVDDKQTVELRLSIRQERIGQEVKEVKKGSILEPGGPAENMLGPSLYLVHTNEGWYVQSKAGYVLARGTTAWRAGAVARPIDLKGYPGQIKLHEDLAMTAFYCPASGTLLAVDLHEKNAPPLEDILLDLNTLTSEPC